MVAVLTRLRLLNIWDAYAGYIMSNPYNFHDISTFVWSPAFPFREAAEVRTSERWNISQGLEPDLWYYTPFSTIRNYNLPITTEDTIGDVWMRSWPNDISSPYIQVVCAQMWQCEFYWELLSNQQQTLQLYDWANLNAFSYVTERLPGDKPRWHSQVFHCPTDRLLVWVKGWVIQ